MSKTKRLIENFSQLSILYSEVLIMPNSAEKEAIIATLDSHFDMIINRLLPEIQDAIKTVKVQSAENPDYVNKNVG
jgi:hypothetical protein